jgi:hypothetical protein
MKIASSDIQMASSLGAFFENTEKSGNVTLHAGKKPAWSSNANDSSVPGAVSDRPHDTFGDTVTLSYHGKTRHLQHHRRSAAEQKCSGCQQSQSSDGMKEQITLMKLLVEKVTGRKMNIFNCERLDPGSVNAAAEVSTPSPGADPAQDEQGVGVSFDCSESYTAVQTFTFSAQGTIKTADGQEINFSMSLEMSLEYHRESCVSLSSGDADRKDPLVINYNGSASELTSAKFSFDLGSDGTQDNVSLHQPGSGLLVLGGNQDGIANDAGQLFTSGTGDRLSELTAYDENLNSSTEKHNIVDDQLSAWSKIPPGKDRMSSLLANSVAAMHLSGFSTLFDLIDKDNPLKGQIAVTGIYAEVSKRIETIQYLSLSV